MKLPKLPPANTDGPAARLSSKDKAQRVAFYIEHRSPPKGMDGYRPGASYYYCFASAVRDYFDATPKARASFIAWYEKQP